MAKNLDKCRAQAKHHEHKLHVAEANRLLPRTQRWVCGAAIVNAYDRLVDARQKANKGKVHGWAALNRGGLTRRFWVVKRPGDSGLRKGAKVFRKRLVRELEARGATFRNITTPSNQDIRDALSTMARFVAEVHHPDQYGFVAQRDCVESAAKHVNARTLFLVDIENAFDQVTRPEVEDILHRVFLIKRAKARLISELCVTTYEGEDPLAKHLYQGNPMAPALFNVRALRAVERLHRLCAGHGLTLTVYADDICISSDTWDHFTKRFQRAVYAIIRECGLRVNPDKCKVVRVDARKVGHYDITGLTVDFDPHTGVPYVRPLHRRRVLAKARYISYLRSRGIELSLEERRDGGYKSLVDVERGLTLWAERQPDPGEYPQARLPLIS